MKIIHCCGPVAMPEIKDILHPIRTLEIILKCKIEHSITPALCDDVIFVEDFDNFVKNYFSTALHKKLWRKYIRSKKEPL